MREFPSMLAFAEHLGTMIVAEIEAEHLALERAAKLIEAEAKREIGTYQDAAGPFVAWAPLADSTLADKEKMGYSPPDNPLLRTGEMRDSIEHTVGVREAEIGSDLDIAVYQELGTTRIPPRSFLGGAAFRKADAVVKVIGEEVMISLVGTEVFGGRTRIE